MDENAPDAIDQAIASATSAGPRTILNMQLDGSRTAQLVLPADLTLLEALQILGSLPGYIIAARLEYEKRTVGGRIVLPS